MRRTATADALLVGALLFLPSPCRGETLELDRSRYHNPRFYGMGGAFGGVSDDRNLFFTNPAGLARLQHGSVGFAFLPVSMNTNTWDVISFYRDNDDRFRDLDNMSDEEQAQFYDDVLDAIGGKQAESAAHLPLAILWPAPAGSRRPSFGLGLFARSGVGVLVEKGAAGIPVVTANLDAGLTGILSAAYSWDALLPGRLSVGGSFKVDHRSLSLNHKSLLELSEDEQLDVLGATGFGADVGALYNVMPSLTVGLAVFDVLSSRFEFETEFSTNDSTATGNLLQPGDEGQVDPSLNLGLAYRPEWSLGPLKQILVAIDLDQPFDSDRSFWKGVFAGAEAHLGRLAPRFGFYQGYPGFGLGLGPIQYAFFSTEAGHFPGAKSNYAHALSLEFVAGF